MVKRSSEGKGLGETDLKKLDFWTKLKSYALEKKVPLFRQTPRPQHWYAGHVSAYKVPKYVEFLDALPLTAVGKPMRNELRKREAETLKI